MKTRRIGSLEVSAIGLGANIFTDFWGEVPEQKEATRLIDAALDAGVTFIDTAEEYSTKTPWGFGRSEEYIGVALGSRRNQMVIASKFSPVLMDNTEERGAKQIINAVEGSLKRLRTDRIDLYQQHMPDPDTPIDEMLEALDRLVRDGKVREIGCCNFSGDMLDAARAASEASGVSRFVSTQNQYNLLDQPTESGVIEACEKDGLMLLPYYPLASGLLSGKYRQGAEPPPGSRFSEDTVVTGILKPRQFSDDRLARVAKLDAFARDRGHTILELAISWLTSQPFVASVIAGATRPEQIQANAAAGNWDLTPQDLDEIARLRA